MKKLMYCLIIASALWLPAARAQVTLFGKITDSFSGEGIDKAKLTLNPFDVTGYTDADGNFRIENVDDTELELLITRIGYKAVRETIKSPSDLLHSRGKKGLSFEMVPSEILSGSIDVFEGRIETQLKYATMPVELVTSHDIEGLPRIAIPNAIEMKTGLNILRDGIWANEISIRGLSRDNVITLINGNRIETANNHAGRLALIDLNTVDRIEFIMGGTSSIYGSGAMGGIVNIVTKSGVFRKKPLVTGNVTGSYAGVNELATLNLSLRYGSPNLYLNALMVTRNATDTKTPSGTIPNSSFRDEGIHINAGTKLSPKSLLKGTFEIFSSPYAGIPGGKTVFPDNSKTSYHHASRIMADATYELNGISESFAKLTARIFYQAINREVEVLPNTSVYVPPTGGNPARRTINSSIYPSGYHDVAGMFLQGDLLVNSGSRLVAGIDTWIRKLRTERERTQIIQTLDSSGAVASSAEVITGDIPVPESRYLSAGAFIQSQTSFMNERFFLDLSARLDGIFITNDETVSPVYTITNGVFNGTPSNQKVVWQATSENDFSWSAGAGFNYRLTENLNGHANFSASYRSPGLEERFQYIDLGSTVRLGNPDLRPERGYFVSGGLKYWSERLNFGAEGFVNFLNDLVVEVPGTFEGRPALIKENVGTSRIEGFDADVEYSPFESTSMIGGISYATGTNTGDDTPLAQIAPFNARLGLTYTAPFDMRFTLNSIFYSSQDRVAQGELTTPGYGTFNLYGNYPLRFSANLLLLVTAGVENILDRNYRNHLSTSRGPVNSEPGRNIFVNLNLKF